MVLMKRQPSLLFINIRKRIQDVHETQRENQKLRERNRKGKAINKINQSASLDMCSKSKAFVFPAFFHFLASSTILLRILMDVAVF
jgi:hypothetical protein